MADGEPTHQRIGVVAVVVTYRRPDAVRTCVEHLLAQTRPLDGVVVVDNDPEKPGIVASTLSFDPPVTVIEAGENTGAAGGFALGVEAARSHDPDWLLFINDDDLADPSLVERQLAVTTEWPDVAAVGADVVTATGTIRVGGRFDRGVRPPPSGDGDRSGVRDVDLATFTGLLVDANALELVGGIDAGHFMMWEEYDVCLRLRQTGRRIVVICQPLVSLPTHGVEGHYPPWRGYYEARNSLITLRRIGGLKAWRWWVWRQLKFTIAGVRLPQGGRRVVLRARGIIDGCRGRRGRSVEPWPQT